MFEIAAELSEWCARGRDFAVATLVSARGSAPRQPGAALAVDAEGNAVGSVSGGCVEGALYELCREAVKSGESALVTFGPDDDDPFAAHLTCGGVIEVLITPILAATRPVIAAALSRAVAGRPVALVRTVQGPAAMLGLPLLVDPDGADQGTLGYLPELDRAAADEARAALDAGHRSARLTLGLETAGLGQNVTFFSEASVSPPRMLVFGAIDFAAALSSAGAFLGYRVTVCDARAVFATADRFPDADEVVVDWPHRYLKSTDTDTRAVICVLTHDPKFDIPLLEQALTLPVAYVGAMGSRRTDAQRRERLLARGVTQAQLARLHSPIGLDLGARTPQETALSIAAEIVAAVRGGTGLPLTGGGIPIHRDAARRVPAAASG